MTVEELQILISMKTEKVRAQIDGVKKKIAEIQPKKPADVDVTTSKAQGNLKKLQSELERTQTKINKLNEKMNGVFAQQDAVAGKYRGLPNVSGMTRDQTLDYMVSNDPKFQQLGVQLDRLDAEAAPLKARLEEVKAKIAAAGSAADPATARTRRFGESMKSAGSHIQGAGRNSGYFGRMVKSMLLSMVLFSGVSLLFRGLSEGMQNMALGSSQANGTMSQMSTSALYLKNSVAAALMPALQALTPVIVQVTDAIAYAFNMFGALTARIFNHASTITVAQRANVNYAATLGKVKQAADEAKRSVMGFDEINALSKPSETTSTGTAGMPAYADMFKTVKVPGWVEKVGEITDKVRAMIESNLGSIKRLLRMAPLVIGAVLAFSGINVPLGIGLMAIGAIEMTKQAKEDWGYLSSQTNTSLDKVKRGLAIAGAVELALGAILAFSGAAVPLGIGLMIGGIATTAATLNWDSLSPQIKNSIGAITFTSAVAMLALGAILAFSGAAIALGVGLLIGGATTIWASATLNWNEMDGKLKTQIGIYTAIASGALLALGVILVCTGHIPLGVGMIVAGSIGLASAAALNWDALKSKMSGKLTETTVMCGTFLLVLGLLLVLTGVALPLGIGLVVAGGAGLATAVAINWDYIKVKIGEALEGVKSKWNEFKAGWNSWGPVQWWKNDVAPWFTKEKWAGLGKQAIDAITAPFKNIHWPKISTPHLEWTSGGWHATGLIEKALSALHLPTQMPKLNVNWYAQGGVFNSPSIIGLGEAGPEAALPLNDNVYSRIGEGIAESGTAFGSGEGIDRVIDRMDRLESAIRNMEVKLYANDQKIAESANRGNASIDRRYHPVATT